MPKNPHRADDAFPWPPTPEDIAEAEVILKETLELLEEPDEHSERAHFLVLTAISFATLVGFKAGFALGWADRLPGQVAYIELPTGQVSWHMPAHPESWDGHTTDEKHARIKAYVGAEVPGGPAPVD